MPWNNRYKKIRDKLPFPKAAYQNFYNRISSWRYTVEQAAYPDKIVKDRRGDARKYYDNYQWDKPEWKTFRSRVSSWVAWKDAMSLERISWKNVGKTEPTKKVELKKTYKWEKENKMLHKEQWRLHRLWSKDTKHIAELEQENKKLKADTEHTIKFNNNIIGKLKLENDKLKVIIKNNDLEQKADWKHIEELEEENKKLKADYIKLSKIVETTWWYKASYVNKLRDEIAKLEKKLKTVTEGEIIIPIYDEEGKLVMKS